jgi:hypothetical protein
MSNRFCTLVGTNKISAEYTKINSGFDDVESELDSLDGRMNTAESDIDTAESDINSLESRATAIEAWDTDNLPNSSNVTGSTTTAAFNTLKTLTDGHTEDISDLDTRIDNIVGYAGTSTVEVVDARYSTEKDVTFSVLGDRINSLDQVTGYNVKDHGLLGNGSDDDSSELNALITALGSTVCTLYFPRGTYKLNDNVSVPSTIELKFVYGAMLKPASGKAITGSNTKISAGLYQIFDLSLGGTIAGTWRVQWVYPQWFGAKGDTTTDDSMAFQNTINFQVLTNGRIYVPRGVYRIETKLVLYEECRIDGESPETAKFYAKVSGDFVMETSATVAYKHKIELKDFSIFGDATTGAGSTSTGGLHIKSANHCKAERLKVSLIATGATGTRGNPATELRPGIKVSGVVGAILNDCYVEKCDVGFLVTNGAASINTSTTFNDCSSEYCRTHAVKWLNTMTTHWNRGIIENNYGLVTMHVENEAAALPNYGSSINGTHFEQNIYGDTGAAGSIEINLVGGNTGFIDSFLVNNVFIDGSAKTSVKVIYNTGLTIFSSSLNSTPDTIVIDSTSVRTTIIGGVLASSIVDSGYGTKVLGSPHLAINDSLALASDTPSVSIMGYAKGLAGTMTELNGGGDGQIIYLEGQYGTVLDGATFQLKNGATRMNLADGSVITLRKDKTSGNWVCIGHEPSVAKATFTNAAAQSIDDRTFWLCGDAAITNITTINFGYDGQEITIKSNHTGANTTVFEDGTGNLKLAGNFTMGQDDTLRLIYDSTTSYWYELSRSVN